jgi:hypothetical protein
MWLNSNPPFNLTVSPGSQTANQGGSATYQISVTGGKLFTGQVSFSLSSSPVLPSGSSVSIGPSTITAPGVSMLSVNIPPVSTSTTYNLTLTATSGSVAISTTVPLVANPPTNIVPASMISPGDGTRLPLTTATFIWDAGIGVSRYQLLIGKSRGMAEYASTTGVGQTAIVTNLPSGISTVWATLNSWNGKSWDARYFSYVVDTVSTGVAPRSANVTIPTIYNDNQDYFGDICLDTSHVRQIRFGARVVAGQKQRRQVYAKRAQIGLAPVEMSRYGLCCGYGVGYGVGYAIVGDVAVAGDEATGAVEVVDDSIAEGVRGPTIVKDFGSGFRCGLGSVASDASEGIGGVSDGFYVVIG